MTACAFIDVPSPRVPVLLVMPEGQGLNGQHHFLCIKESERRLGDVVFSVKCRLGAGLTATVPPAWLRTLPETPLAIPTPPAAS